MKNNLTIVKDTHRYEYLYLRIQISQYLSPLIDEYKKYSFNLSMNIR